MGMDHPPQRFHFHLSAARELVFGPGRVACHSVTDLASQSHVIATVLYSMRWANANPTGCGFIPLLKGPFNLQTSAVESLDYLSMALF